jgi:hypothetical protein
MAKARRTRGRGPLAQRPTIAVPSVHVTNATRRATTALVSEQIFAMYRSYNFWIDCPTTGGTRSKAKSGPALSCFKCGEEGHFSNGTSISSIFISYANLTMKQPVLRMVVRRKSGHRALAEPPSAARARAVHQEAAGANAVEVKKEHSEFLVRLLSFGNVLIMYNNS